MKERRKERIQTISDPRMCYYGTSVLADEDRKPGYEPGSCFVNPVGYYQSVWMKPLKIRQYMCEKHLRRIDKWAEKKYGKDKYSIVYNSSKKS